MFSLWMTTIALPEAVFAGISMALLQLFHRVDLCHLLFFGRTDHFLRQDGGRTLGTQEGVHPMMGYSPVCFRVS